MATTDKKEDASSQPGEPVRFQAEIRQLLDILVHSLYTRREVFLRELISNASDALNRMQFEMLTNTDVVDAQVAAAVRITVDEAGKRLTISDTGVGMSRAELVENLGTIARSGAQRFIENAKETGTDASDIIGRFGVGFYSVFMIAEEVRVTSRSFRPTDEAACWVCTGGESFTLESSDRRQRGTLIEIKLREEAAEFADAFRITQIVKQHSDYVPFPIYVGKQADKPGEFKIANQQTALWRQSARDLKAGEYVEFFRQLTFSGGDPLLHIHYVADAPVQIYSILFVPAKAGRDLFTARYESGIRLHARKILIEENCRSLVPEYLRFLQGPSPDESPSTCRRRYGRAGRSLPARWRRRHRRRRRCRGTISRRDQIPAAVSRVAPAVAQRQDADTDDDQERIHQDQQPDVRCFHLLERPVLDEARLTANQLLCQPDRETLEVDEARVGSEVCHLAQGAAHQP